MSRDWTHEELMAVSDYNKRHGWMSYEEFCEFIDKCEEEKMTVAEMALKKILDEKAEFKPDKFIVTSMAQLLGVPGVPMPAIWVVTSPGFKYGAYGILDKDIQRIVQEKVRGEKFFVIPSSIHELLLLPADVYDSKDLLQMVKEVNFTEVSEEDKIGDTLFFFDGKHLQFAGY